MDRDKPILVTGTAGFIGFHLARRLLEEGFEVVGVDCVNDYYSVDLKEDRINLLQAFEGFTFFRFNLMEKERLMEIFETYQFDYVVNLAAQAGVRHSLTHPQDYVDSNITGFLNILEGCRHYQVRHLVYASSSSVYGANTRMPFSEHQNLNHPLSLYAASKKCNEFMAHAYGVNFGLATTGLRFFSVYGPWGRPDMALFLFTEGVLRGKPIDVFNNGKMTRNFTYIDDVVEGVFRLIHHVAAPSEGWDAKDPDPAGSYVPYRLFNIGNNKPVDLMQFIRLIEAELGKKAEINYLPIQKGDVPATFADVSDLQAAVGYKPSTSIETGIKNFVGWYRDYYKV